MHHTTREAFYERVWADPLAKLAEEFGTTGIALKKLCLEAGIPLPGTGHWSKLHSGKPVTRARLLMRPPGASVILTIRRTWWANETNILHDPPPLRPEFSESVEEIVANAMIALGTARHDPKLPSVRGRTTPDSRHQYLLDALRSAFRAVGCELRIMGGQLTKALSVRIGAVELPFTLTPMVSHPDGLCLHLQLKESCIKMPQTFLDEEGRPLESRLRDIVITMLTAAEMQYRSTAMWDYESLIERRAKAVEDERQRRAEAKRLREQRRIERAARERDLLLTQAQNWRTAHDIRGFVADILAQAETATMQQTLSTWADWALQQADLIDPVKQSVLRAARRKTYQR